MAGPRGDSSSRVFFMKNLILILFIVSIPFSILANLVDKRAEVAERRRLGSLNLKSPYVPQKVDYSLEIGSFWSQQSHYWLGGSIESHIGSCFFLRFDGCQQYLGLHAASAGRDGITLGVFQGSLRFQYVILPKSFSPFIRILAGGLLENRFNRTRFLGIGGVGFGVNLVLNPSVDLRVETRYSYADRSYYTGFLGFHVKTDRLLSVFAKKLKDLGIDLVSETAKSAEQIIIDTKEEVESVIRKKPSKGPVKSP